MLAKCSCVTDLLCLDLSAAKMFQPKHCCAVDIPNALKSVDHQTASLHDKHARQCFALCGVHNDVDFSCLMLVARR